MYKISSCVALVGQKWNGSEKIQNIDTSTTREARKTWDDDELTIRKYLKS